MGCLGWDLGGQSSIPSSVTNSPGALGQSPSFTCHPNTHTLVCFFICTKWGPGDYTGFFQCYYAVILRCGVPGP